MKKLFNNKKKLTIIIAVVLVAIIAAVLVALFFTKDKPKAIVNKVDKSYSEILKKENLSLADLDKSLKDYSKEQKNDEIVYTKDNETVIVKTDENGNIVYLSYNKALSDDEQINIKSFNESMIKIGDNEQDVLKLLEEDSYIYNLNTINDEGKKLHIYYFGWTSKEAILELVFTDSKLTYYTLNSQDIASKSDAPDVDEAFGK